LVKGRGQVQVFGHRCTAKKVLSPKIGPDPDCFNGLPEEILLPRPAVSVVSNHLALFVSAESQGVNKYVSLFWLRKMKSAAGPPKDHLDLENLPE
jgi:hypothetical protein